MAFNTHSLQGRETGAEALNHYRNTQYYKQSVKTGYYKLCKSILSYSFAYMSYIPLSEYATF